MPSMIGVRRMIGTDVLWILVLATSPLALGRGSVYVSPDGSTMDSTYPSSASSWEILAMANAGADQHVLYVDDDAWSDPVKNDPSVGDPDEDGTLEHPFDSIQEAIGRAVDGASIRIMPGTYREDVDFMGGSIQLIGLDINAPAADLPIIEGTGRGPVVTCTHGTNPNCVLVGLTISRGGGQLAGAIFGSDCAFTLANCLVVGNRAIEPTGATLLFTRSSLRMLNCTIADNIPGPGGAVLRAVDSEVIIANSILWDTTPQPVRLEGASTKAITYTDVSGGILGRSCINEDPLFVRPGHWVDGDALSCAPGKECESIFIYGDYHVRSQAGRWDPMTDRWQMDFVTSPCIDQGDPADPVRSEPCPNGERINLGAYGGTHTASRSPTGPVCFGEAKLRKAVEQALGISDPTPPDMLGLTKLVVVAKWIRSIAGLEFAASLQELWLSDNDIHDITPLAGLTNLKILALNQNHIGDNLSPLADLTNLEHLDIHQNGINDVTALRSLTSLHTLVLRENCIRDLSPLAGLTRMRTLILWHNPIEDLSPLASLTALQSLYLQHDLVRDITALGNMKDLRELLLEDNEISDLSPLLELRALKLLDVSNNPLNSSANEYLDLIAQNNPGIEIVCNRR